MSALILIELNGSEVSANSRAALTAASQLSDNVDALVLTSDSTNASSVAAINGINTVKMIVDDSLEHASVEVASKLIADVMSDYKFLVSGSSTYSKNILPRVGVITNFWFQARLLTVKIFCLVLAPFSTFSLSQMSVRLNHITHLFALCMQVMLWQR